MIINNEDLVVDEYGNYYCVTKVSRSGGKVDKIEIINAFMMYSMYDLFMFNDESWVNEKKMKYNEKPIGTVALNALKSSIELKAKQTRIYKLSDIKEMCQVTLNKYL